MIIWVYDFYLIIKSIDVPNDEIFLEIGLDSSIMGGLYNLINLGSMIICIKFEFTLHGLYKLIIFYEIYGFKL